jgi:hypothetical protein
MHKETCTQVMVLILLSVEKHVFSSWFSATANPSDFLHRKQFINIVQSMLKMISAENKFAPIILTGYINLQ